ncbi:MAG: type III-B CRISPR module RAMP protein Cmr1 [Methanotrichaceae archaeon]
MGRLAVTLETVTPLFLGGADPRGVPELRAPSFRGALRYWLRAALGGVVYDVEAVRSAESAIFGSTEENAGGDSVVAVRITGRPSLTIKSYSQIAEWNAKSGSYRKPGIAYLLFTARGTRQEQERKALFGTFTMNLQTRPGIAQEEDNFKKAYIALWLLTHLGGVGSRSRRGAGALQAVTMQSTSQSLEDLPPLNICANNPEELSEELQQGLNTIRQFFGIGKPQFSLQKPPVFDIIHPEACKIWIINKTYQEWNDALDAIGRVYHGFRTRRSPDYMTVRTSMSRGTPLSKPVERAAFGLPIPFYFRSLSGAGGTLDARKHNRRASPMWIRIVKLANGSYAVVILWFQSEFLPVGEQLQLQLRLDHKTVTGEVPDSRLLQMFLMQRDHIKHSSLKDKGLDLLEVHYA